MHLAYSHCYFMCAVGPCLLHVCVCALVHNCKCRWLSIFPSPWPFSHFEYSSACILACMHDEDEVRVLAQMGLILKYTVKAALVCVLNMDVWRGGVMSSRCVSRRFQATSLFSPPNLDQLFLF